MSFKGLMANLHRSVRILRRNARRAHYCGKEERDYPQSGRSYVSYPLLPRGHTPTDYESFLTLHTPDSPVIAFVNVPSTSLEEPEPVMFKSTLFERITIVEEEFSPSFVDTVVGVHPSTPITTMSSLCSGREIRARGDVAFGTIP